MSPPQERLINNRPPLQTKNIKDSLLLQYLDSVSEHTPSRASSKVEANNTHSRGRADPSVVHEPTTLVDYSSCMAVEESIHCLIKRASMDFNECRGSLRVFPYYYQPHHYNTMEHGVRHYNSYKNKT